MFGGVLLATIGYATFAVATGRNPADALIVGIAVFIAWAIGRELDPDRSEIAAWAMPLCFAAAVYDLPSAGASAVALIGIRLVSGTIGAAVTRLDVGVLALLGFAAGSTSVLWIVGLTLAASLLIAPEVGSFKWVALAFLAAGFAGGMVSSGALDVETSRDAYMLAAVAGVVALLAMRPSVVTSRTDARTGSVDVGRVGLARKTAGVFVMWAAVMGGVAGFWMMSPVLAALVATAVARWFSPSA